MLVPTKRDKQQLGSAAHTCWFSTFQHTSSIVAEVVREVRELSTGRASCSELGKPAAVPGAELLELSPSQKSVLQHYRSLHITALKQSSSYLITSPNACSTIVAEIFFNFSHQSCSSCMVARTGKLQCPAHHLPAPAWQKPYRQGAKAPGFGGGQFCGWKAVLQIHRYGGGQGLLCYCSACSKGWEANRPQREALNHPREVNCCVFAI